MDDFAIRRQVGGPGNLSDALHVVRLDFPIPMGDVNGALAGDAFNPRRRQHQVNLVNIHLGVVFRGLEGGSARCDRRFQVEHTAFPQSLGGLFRGTEHDNSTVLVRFTN
jgi:hypothetical protein